MTSSHDVVTLREYLEAQIAAVESRAELRDEALRETMDRSEAVFNRRIAALTDTQAQVASHRNEYATNERLDDATNTMRSLYDALVANINTANETLRENAERDLEALRDRMDKEGKLRDDALNSLSRQLPGFLTNDRANTILSEGQTRWETIRSQYEREGKARDDAINALQQNYSGLVGRISGMGIIIVLASLALQIIVALATHGVF